MIEVVLVNENNEVMGTIEKMEAHRKGLLHRAFSIFIFNENGEMLIQQRSSSKYHGALLWTNACCSHPYPGEEISVAAHRRLKEELGIEIPLTEIFSFLYRADVENNLVEHEYDHVFAGEYSKELHPDANEVADYAYCTMNDLSQRLQQHPERFTTWFCIAFPRIKEWWQAKYNAYSK